MIKKFIIEGVDCSGKSTLAIQLQKDLFARNLEYKIISFPFLEVKQKYGEIQARQLAQRFYLKHLMSEDNEIFDRSIITNYIYALIYCPEISQGLLMDFVELKRPDFIKIFFLLPKMSVIEERLKNHVKHEIKLKTIQETYHLFESLALEMIDAQEYNIEIRR